MAKTAMMELIEVLEGNVNALPDYDKFPHIKAGLRNAILCAKGKLEKERQQIQDAVNEGMSGTMDAKEYYNKTFNQ